MTRGNKSQIRFADLPKASQPIQSPVGFVQFFSHEDLELVEGVPIAACYLLISISTLVGTQEYIRYAIATVTSTKRQKRSRIRSPLGSLEAWVIGTVSTIFGRTRHMQQSC